MPVHCYAASESRAPLTPYSYEPLPLGPFDVEIAITHCGICRSDIHLIDNDWEISKYPLVPGHEIVGTVRAVGSAVTRVPIGQRVGVGWQAGSCLECEWCIRGEEQSCAKQVATCVDRPGGFAEAIRLDSRFAFPIPESLPSEQVGPLLCGGITVYTPLRRAARPASRVGVVGIGGLGHLALQFARGFGCEVTAFSTTPGKEGEARRLGAHRFIVSTDPAQMDQAANSLDVILSTATASQDWSAFLKALRPHGVLCLVGAPAEKLAVWPMALVVGEKTISGSKIGNRAAIQEMLEFAARHAVKAQVEVMPLEEVNAALDRVRQNRARFRMVLATG